MKLSILTINCYESPLSNNRQERIDKLVIQLLKRRYDFVLLQEIILQSTAKSISQLFEKKGYYTFYSSSNIFNKGGLFFASKYPIISASFHKFLTQGDLISQQLSDRVLGKGYQTIKVQINEKTEVKIINTHLIAIYKNLNKEFLQLNKQLKELILGINMDQENIILCGDLNFEPKDKEYDLLLKSTNLVDLSKNISKPTISITNSNKVGNFWNDSINKKLDYILCSKSLIKSYKSKVEFDNLYMLKKNKAHLSDHFGISSEIYI